MSNLRLVRAPSAKWGVAIVAASLVCLLASCGNSAAVGGSAPSGPGRHHSAPPSTPTSTTTTTPPTTTTTEQPGWTVVSTETAGIAVDERTISGSDGGAVTVVRFHSGLVRFNLHVGTLDPPIGTATISTDSGPAIGPNETHVLLAAFNGGFKVNAHAGGVELDGQVLTPLLAGMASLVIDANGQAQVGVWGQGLPMPGEDIASVRQNLPPLVVNGVTSPSVANVAVWGAMLGPGPAVPRSALGEDAQGDLLYAAGMSLVPADLAGALVQTGSLNAMELDINPEWIQADAASSGGNPLAALIPGQNRPADQYQLGWTRDFVTVLATH